MKDLYRSGMKSLKLDEIKQIQISVLNAFDKFCSEHSLKYSLSDGTLLGAVRHRGYIPWDDDIDVVMPRKDFNRFEREFPEIYENRYKLASFNRDSNWNRVYANLYDNNTLLIENPTGYNIGVNIDIFPLDEVPDNVVEWDKYVRKLKFYYGLQAVKLIPYNKKRGWLKNLILALLKLLTSCIPDRMLAKKCFNIATMNNNRGYKSMYACCFGYYNRHPFPNYLFDNITSLTFENNKYKAFSDYQTYLTIAYGDYMTLPPEEQRITHHHYEAFIKP